MNFTHSEKVTLFSITVVLCGWLVIPRITIGMQAAVQRQKFRNVVRTVHAGLVAARAGELSSGNWQNEVKNVPQLKAALLDSGHCISDNRRLKIEALLAEYQQLGFAYLEDVATCEPKKVKLVSMLDEIIRLAR